MLAKKFRLGRKQLNLIYKKGTNRGFGELGVKFMVNAVDYSRFAIVIPKKVVASVVKRNRYRRVIYDEVQKFTLKSQKNGDFLIRMFKEIEDDKILRKNVSDSINLCLNLLH